MDFKIKLLEKNVVAKDTQTYVFDKPEGFTYKAGEYIFLILPHLVSPDPRGNTRHFTLSSSPTEKDLTITMRMRESGYKKTLDSLPIGTVLDMQDSPDTFYWDNDEETSPQIFIAGGMGVSPFRSIIKYISDKNISSPIHLIYSNKTPEDIVFQDELDAISKKNSNIKVFHTITRPNLTNTTWDGYKGRIDKDLIEKLTTNSLSPTYWLCGPPDMVSSMEEILEELSVSGQNIKVEKFTGY